MLKKKDISKKIKTKKNRYDKFNKNFYLKVQNGFLKLSNKNKRKYQIIDSNLDINVNKSLIVKTIDKLIWIIKSQLIKPNYLVWINL